MFNSQNPYPNVLILMAAYNGGIWIDEQVRSILIQKKINLKLVISVDKSDDNTLDICRKFSEKNKNVEILPYGKRYGGASKNFYRLIREVNFHKFDYIALSDQDDIWFDNKITYSIKKLRSNKCKAFSSDVLAYWPNGKTKIIKKSWPQKKFDFLFESAGPGCTYLLERDSFVLFQNFLIKNWNEINNIEFHDWIIYAYFRTNNLNWHIDEVPFMKYRQHANNYFGQNYGVRAIKKRLLLIKNNWYKTEILKIKNILKIGNDLNLSFRLKNFLHLRRRPRDILLMLFFNLFGLF